MVIKIIDEEKIYYKIFDDYDKYLKELKLLKMKNLFLKLRNIIVGNWRNLTGYTSDEQ